MNLMSNVLVMEANVNDSNYKNFLKEPFKAAIWLYYINTNAGKNTIKLLQLSCGKGQLLSEHTINRLLCFTNR